MTEVIRRLWRFFFWYCAEFAPWPPDHWMAREDACYCCGHSVLTHPIRTADDALIASIQQGRKRAVVKATQQ